MTADQLRTVVEVACLTADRAPAEQRALLAAATHVENDLNKATNRNLARRADQPACTLVDLVESTYDPADEGRPVAVNAAVRAKLERRRQRWTEDSADFLARGRVA